ncbi:helix-turn-helix transcriptional regulator [Kiloniella majae]|uniref:helix-turn-helix transcriptional regulator n=1 Tax=Kiloniella majae TaxID=1938558 RepID=UPI000A279691|nr:AraC family transcriptional regulator [Kiloniella majae]
MRPEELYIYKTLKKVGAQSSQTLEVGSGLSLSAWHNDGGYAVYERASHHTLSYYLQGGKGTRRHNGERSLGKGHPGAVCIMPAGVRSEWSIEAPFKFMHLYFDQAEFDRIALESYDIDPNLVELEDVAFQSDPVIEQLFRQVILPLDWQNPADRMSLSHAGQLLIQHLFRCYSNKNAEPEFVRGGLSPFITKRVKDYIEEVLDQGLVVEDLAAIAELSPFHFTRMFQLTMGVSPYQYVLSRRVQKAKDLLGDTHNTLSAIAFQCGFSSQSHLTTRFSRATGLTPSKFRQLS